MREQYTQKRGYEGDDVGQHRAPVLLVVAGLRA